MEIRGFFSSAYRLIRSATKPDREEFWLLFRVVLLGVVVVGAIGFVIRYVFALIGLTGGL
ncbi:MAG: protein translocase SEC61 complex subunit gamma [Candidatus Bathyarchaeia archaeon]